jgi:hypothetical protein
VWSLENFLFPSSQHLGLLCAPKRQDPRTVHRVLHAPDSRISGTTRLQIRSRTTVEAGYSGYSWEIAPIQLHAAVRDSNVASISSLNFLLVNAEVLDQNGQRATGYRSKANEQDSIRKCDHRFSLRCGDGS